MTRTLIPVTIAGHPTHMLAPTKDMLFGAKMLDKLGEEAKIRVLTDLFMSCLADDESRERFISQLVTGTATVADFMETLQQLVRASANASKTGTAEQDTPATPIPAARAKAAPRKTVAKRRARK